MDLGIEFILTGAILPGYQFDFKRLMKLHEQAAGRIKIMVALGGAFKTPDLPQLLMRFPVDDVDKDVIHACHLIPEHRLSPSCRSRLPNDDILRRIQQSVSGSISKRLQILRPTLVVANIISCVSLSVHTKKKKTVIAFILVPQVKMPKLINFESESERWQNKVPSLILQNWSEDE